MNTRTLRYFVATAEALHVGRAAEQLGVAQPALSQQIRVLEAQLGVQLFHRAHRRIELTDAGKVFLAEARQLLTASDRATRLARDAARGAAGELHVGYTGSVVFEPRLRRVLRRFQSAYPAVTLNMHEHTVEGLLAALQDMRLDIAFLRGPVSAMPAGVDSTVYSTSPLMAALPADHRLAAESSIDPKALADEGFITLLDSPGYGLADSLRFLGERAGFAPRIVLKAGSVMSVLGLVGAGLGVSIIPEFPLEFSSSSFVLRPLDDAEATTQMLLATRSRITSAIERRFLQTVKEAAENPIQDSPS
jgi:DNA-binding transcriptional LysR family regulator